MEKNFVGLGKKKKTDGGACAKQILLTKGKFFRGRGRVLWENWEGPPKHTKIRSKSLDPTPLVGVKKDHKGGQYRAQAEV